MPPSPLKPPSYPMGHTKRYLESGSPEPKPIAPGMRYRPSKLRPGKGRYAGVEDDPPAAMLSLSMAIDPRWSEKQFANVTPLILEEQSYATDIYYVKTQDPARLKDVLLLIRHRRSWSAALEGRWMYDVHEDASQEAVDNTTYMGKLSTSQHYKCDGGWKPKTDITFHWNVSVNPLAKHMLGLPSLVPHHTHSKKWPVYTSYCTPAYHLDPVLCHGVYRLALNDIIKPLEAGWICEFAWPLGAPSELMLKVAPGLKYAPTLYMIEQFGEVTPGVDRSYRTSEELYAADLVRSLVVLEHVENCLELCARLFKSKGPKCGQVIIIKDLHELARYREYAYRVKWNSPTDQTKGMMVDGYPMGKIDYPFCLMHLADKRNTLQTRMNKMAEDDVHYKRVYDEIQETQKAIDNAYRFAAYRVPSCDFVCLYSLSGCVYVTIMGYGTACVHAGWLMVFPAGFHFGISNTSPQSSYVVIAF